ncbi:hypothetical protein DUNSADRAFT_1441 [Dunaliella salina]|uniref:Protein NO VEIN C-terminal domain-containing protein n=1 Tax=Dunaliella salina TaxID=3046 RepID=A0ABQ7FXG5_DUNSA|nr:hypothetical protein DUNSADRAFT_1441 [Dunaliella salina]|eukprot:KAF5827046.1 hypothetical protein DUNSADRAFT_1441 [Dunaliella salina]
MKRSRHGNNLIHVTKEVFHLTSCSRMDTLVCRYLSVREQKDIPPMQRRMDDDRLATKVSMEIAFQLPADSSKEEPQQHMTYAFLPMACHGLRFILNADFETVANRKEFDRGNEYNLHTLSLFPDLVLKALQPMAALEVPLGRMFSGLDWYLKCLPRVLDLRDSSFVPPTESLHEALRYQPCIPTEDGHMVTPPEAVVCSDPGIAEVLEQLRPHGLVSKHLVHRNISALCASSPGALQLRQQLDIEYYSIEHLPRFAHSVCNRPGLLQELGPGWVAKLLLCVMRAPQPQQREYVLQKLRPLRLLKLQGAPDVYVAGAGVSRALLHQLPPLPGSQQQQQQQQLRLFFPLTASSNPTLYAQLSAAGGSLTPHKMPLPQLDPAILSVEGPSTSNAQVLWQALLTLGVCVLTPAVVLEQYVLPLFDQHRVQLPSTQSRAQLELQQQELIAALRFVILATDFSDKALLQDVRERVVVVTNKGRRHLSTSPQPIFIPPTLGNPHDLARCFPTYTWTLLSHSYTSATTDISSSQFFSAFRCLGAHAWLPLQRSRVVLQQAEVQARAPCNPAAEAVESMPASEHAPGATSEAPCTYVAVDCACPEFVSLVKVLASLGESPIRRTQHFLDLQAQLCEHLQLPEYRDALATVATATWGGQGAGSDSGDIRAPPTTGSTDSIHSIPICSSFAISLRTLPWMLSREGIPAPPSSLFLLESFKDLLFDKVLYVHSKTDRRLFGLGVNLQPSFELLLRVLKDWAGKETVAGHGAQMTSSILEMSKLYRWLLTHARRHGFEAEARLVDAFRASPLLWLPPKESWQQFKSPNQARLSMVGHFYSTHSARLNDNSHVLEAISWSDQRIRIIGLYYRDEHASFFSCPLYHPSHAADATRNTELSRKGDVDGVSEEANVQAGDLELRKGRRPLVRQGPTLEEYVTVLEVLRDRMLGKTGSREDKAFVEKIFAAWNDWLSRMGGNTRGISLEPEELEVLPTRLACLLESPRKVFPTASGGWASLQDPLYINDDLKLASQLARMCIPVHYLKLPSLPILFSRIGVPSLSKSVGMGLPEDTPRKASQEAARLCKDALSCLQALLYAEEDQGRHVELCTAGISRILPLLCVELHQVVCVCKQLLGPSGPLTDLEQTTSRAALVLAGQEARLLVQGHHVREMDPVTVAWELSRLCDAMAIHRAVRALPLRTAAQPDPHLAGFLERVLTRLLAQQSPLDALAAEGLQPVPHALSWVEPRPNSHPLPPSLPHAPPSPGQGPTSKAHGGAAAPAPSSSDPASAAQADPSSSPTNPSSGSKTAAVVPKLEAGSAAEGAPVVGVLGTPLESPNVNAVSNAQLRIAQAPVKAAEMQAEKRQQRGQQAASTGGSSGQRQQQQQQQQSSSSGGGEIQAFNISDLRRFTHAQCQPILNAARRYTGLKGEEAVVLELVRQLSGGSGGGHTVTWVNEKSESYLPFDIKVEPPLDGTARAAKKKCTFIEVKSSSVSSKRFKLSEAELRKAFEEGSAYEIFLVQSDGMPEFKRLINPVALWQQGKIAMHCELMEGGPFAAR